MKKFKVFLLAAIIVILVAVSVALIVLAIHGVNNNKNLKNPIVTLNVEGYGEIQIELYPEYAPNTTSTIVKLVQNGFYNGKVFYGIDSSDIHFGMIKNEVEETTETGEAVQTVNAIEDELTVSDIDLSVANGSEKDYKVAIKGEFVANGYENNTLRFEKGVVGLYRPTYMSYDSTDLTEESYNSGTSLVFIALEERSALNGLYTPFGKVIKGLDVLEEIYKLETVELEEGQEDQIRYFKNLPVITSATVDTFGRDFGTPIYQEAFDYQQYYTDILLQYYQQQ